MKLHLLHELMGLNQAFENVILGLGRMEKLALFDKEQFRHIRALVETGRVDANREFFDKFDEIVAKDAGWAYKFCREYDRRTKDPFDIYLEIKEREEARRTKGLPPRVALLPDWDKDDEQHYDGERTEKRGGKKRRKAAPRSKSKFRNTAAQVQTGVTRTPKKEN